MEQQRKSLGNKKLYHNMNQFNVPETLDFSQGKKKENSDLRAQRREKIEKNVSRITDTSAAGLIANAASAKQIVPGLSRQPKTLEAVGLGGMMKVKESLDEDQVTNYHKKSSKSKPKGNRKWNQILNGPAKPEAITTAFIPSIGQLVNSVHRITGGAGGGGSGATSNVLSQRGSLNERASQIEKSSAGGGTKASTLTLVLDSDSMTEDDENWETDTQGNREEVDNEDQNFEMATVEIDVHDAQKVIDDVLARMLAEGRITSRMRAVLSEKFELFLQALVSFQEREVEVIEFLNMKAEILKILKNFVATEEDIAEHLVIAEEEVIEEAQERGILDTKPKSESANGHEVKEGDGKTRTDSQGLSVAEMSAVTIRDTLLAQKNKIEMQEHMKTIHILELRQLEFEKALLDIHYSRMTKPADVHREVKELKRTVHDLQMQVSQNGQEIQQYQLDIGVEEKAFQDDETLVEKLDLEVLTKQMQVQTNANKPIHLAKEADRDANKLEVANDEYQNLCAKHLDGMETIRTYHTKLDSLMNELHSLIREESKMTQIRKHSLHETESLVGQMETLVTREQQLLERSAQMTEKMGSVMKIRKKLQEDVYTVTNETNKALREATKIERTLRMTSDAHINAKLAYDKMRLAFDSAHPKDDAHNWDKLTRMLQREIANLKIALNQKLDEATIKADMVDKLQRKLNELYDEQLSSGKELQNLIRLTVRKRREREEKSEQCIKLEAQIFRLIQDAKIQKLVLDDCSRTEKDLHHSMDYIKTQYNKIKIARSALMNDLISAKQKVSEQSEKFKICKNEVESYTNQCMERQKEIHRAHYLTLNASLARDSVRNQALRCRDKYRFYQNEKNEILLTNKTFRKEVTKLQAEVNGARARFEKATHDSNRKSMMVRERTEELCTIAEKIKVYELILMKGNRELTIREMELTKLNSVLVEIQKNTVVTIAKQPDDNKIVETIEKLRQEFYETTAIRRQMEEDLNDVSNPKRVRNVHHELIEKRETMPLLQSKLSQLEEALAVRECQGLEKELILKQVTHITEDSMDQANYLKETYKRHTHSLCTLRKQLYHMSNKIDGMISEASLAITQADLAEKQYQKLVQELESAEKRFGMGLAPVPAMLEEWKHNLWRQEMLRRSKENKDRRLLSQVRTLKGSQIIMERLRPHKKSMFESTLYSSVVCRLPQV